MVSPHNWIRAVGVSISTLLSPGPIKVGLRNEPEKSCLGPQKIRVFWAEPDITGFLNPSELERFGHS